MWPEVENKFHSRDFSQTQSFPLTPALVACYPKDCLVVFLPTYLSSPLLLCASSWEFRHHPVLFWEAKGGRIPPSFCEFLSETSFM